MKKLSFPLALLLCISFLSNGFAFPVPPVGGQPSMANGLVWSVFAGGGQGGAHLLLDPDLRFLPQEQRTKANEEFVASAVKAAASEIFDSLNDSLWWARQSEAFVGGHVDGSVVLKAYPEDIPNSATPGERLFAQSLALSPQLYLKQAQLPGLRRNLTVAYLYSSDPRVLDVRLRSALKAAIVFSLGLPGKEFAFSYGVSGELFSPGEKDIIRNYEVGNQWILSLLAGAYDLSKVRQSTHWTYVQPVRLSRSAISQNDVTLFWDGVETLSDGSREPLKASALAGAGEVAPALTGAMIPRGKALCGGIQKKNVGSTWVFSFQDPRFSDPVSVNLALTGPQGLAYESQLSRFLEFAAASPACGNKVIKACVWSDWLPSLQFSIPKQGDAPKLRYVEPNAFAPLDFNRGQCAQTPSAQYPADDYLYL